MTNKGGRSVFKKFLISYILIAAVPVISLGSMIYYYNVIVYQRNVEESNLDKLVQVKNQVDSELKALKDVTYHISSSTQILDWDVSTEKWRKEPEILSQLQAYMENCPFLDDILFYYRGDKDIYGTEGLYYYHDFETDIRPDLNWWGSNFFKNLNSIISPRTARIETEKMEQDIDMNNTLVAFIHPVPYLNTLPRATIVYFMKETYMLSKFENFFGDFEGHIFVFDNYYNLLVSNQSATSHIDRDKLEEECRHYKNTGVLDIDMEDNRYIAMRIVSEETGWSYVVAMPPNQFFKNVKIRRTAVLGAILVVIIIGSLLALGLSKKNYRPIKALASYIKNQDIQHFHYDGENEFEMIRFSFEKSYEQNRELIIQMDAQRPFVRDQCLAKLFRGKIKDMDELDYLMKCSNLDLEGTAYFAMVISIKMRGMESIDVEDLLKLLEDMFFVGARGYGVELAHEEMVSILVSIEKDTDDLKSVQAAIPQDVLLLVNDSIGIEPVIGVGNIYRDILEVNTSFLEASSAIYENAADRSSNIFFFSDMGDSKEGLGWYSIKEQSLYIESLKQGNKRVAIDTLNSIIDGMYEETVSYFMVRCMCFDILNNVMKYIDKIHMENFSIDIKRLVMFDTLDEFRSEMERFTREFCDYIDEFTKDTANKLKSNIIKYVNDNYTSDQISLENIAARFNISSTYVSRFFKEETGVNFIDYITNKRMEYAKRQLRSTDKFIKDIALEIGYIDASSFTRKFREVEGVTPGQYRKMTQQIR